MEKAQSKKVTKNQYTDKRSDAQMVKDNIIIADLTLKRWTQVQIAEHLALSQPTISRALTSIYKQWESDAIQKIDTLKMRELEKLDMIERTLWKAWEASIGETTKKKVSKIETPNASGTSNNRQRVEISQEFENGNPQYIKLILECVDKRARLLGLNLDAVDLGGDIRLLVSYDRTELRYNA